MPAALTDLRLPASAVCGIGLLGTALIGWGSCHPEFAFGSDGWPSAAVNAIGSALPLPWNRLAVVIGVLLLVAAWWLARPGAADPTYRRRLLIAAALWSVPLLVVPRCSRRTPCSTPTWVGS